MVKDNKFFKYLSITLISFVLLSVFLLPNCFSGKWYINPVIINIGQLEIRWYGVLIAFAIFLATFIAEKQSIKEKISENDLFSAILLGVIFGIIGARLYFVVFNLDYFSNNPSEILKTWHGGMAIHGGIIGAVFSTFLFTKLKKNCTLKFLQGLDLFAFVLPLAQSIGRWGNFTNHEAYGSPTSLPWKMFIEFKNRMPGYESYEFFHPTFLYESIWDLVSFFILFYYLRNKRNNYGEIFSLYLMLYSVGRGFIEFLRLDSLMLGEKRVAVLISILLFILGLIIFIYLKKSPKKTLEE